MVDVLVGLFLRQDNLENSGCMGEKTDAWRG